MNWLAEEGLALESSKEDQLSFLWHTFLFTRSCLDSVTKDLETNRLQHFAEMAGVRKSLEQIKIYTEQKDILAQEIQDENEQLRKQLLHLLSLQDAQTNEVAKMLYQHGLTELIPSSPSEQVAYLLVERASLLEMNQDPCELTCDGDTGNQRKTLPEPVNTSKCPSSHKRPPRHLQSSWKKIFGLYKPSEAKHSFVPDGETCLIGQPRHLEKKCSRLELDVEEGSRRLAMAHTEIRRLKDELESAHCTQKTYEMVELRKAKELNDRLDLEIRALRNRVRSLDAEKNSLKKTECPGCLKARNALLCDQDEHENLQREICEALNCVDEERSKYHNMKDKFMEKLCRAKQKLDEETVWRDKRISNLERELSLCYHSMKKEKEVVKCVTTENEKLLSERRKLLQQLSEEEDNMKNLKLTASLTKTRVEYLETENKNLGNKMLQMSNLIATLERRLQNMQCLHFTEELQKMSTQHHTFTPPLTTRLLHEAQDSLDRPYYSDTKQADLTTSPGCIASATLSRTAEVGYLNLSSTQRASEKSKLQSAFRTSENETS
ncbi:coiled-coil domain-containing protein 30 isoform X3 [Cyprinodon tularosa]|uniref:coiled-coil domain-containing protein 30 isoform X3 n=1 Tax=Cyprinodon tularosa TaxID=77115 RepID=UPI0018E217E1|nr:coiled-coil domain-containing protein 30 isoform X3 [Cyprinodon tularosa]